MSFDVRVLPSAEDDVARARDWYEDKAELGLAGYRMLSALKVFWAITALCACGTPVEVTYEVTSDGAKSAGITYWEEPGGKRAKLEGEKLPFRKTVTFKAPGDWSTNVTATVQDGEATCTAYFDGEEVRSETGSVCVANAHYRQ